MSDMTYYTEKLMRENRKFKKFIEDFQLGVNLFPEQNGLARQLAFSVKGERPQSPGTDKLALNKSVWDTRKSGTPFVDNKRSFHFKENCFKKVNSDAKVRKNANRALDKTSPVQKSDFLISHKIVSTFNNIILGYIRFYFF